MGGRNSNILLISSFGVKLDNPFFIHIRTVTIDDEPWLVGKDVAVALGYENPQKALRDHVEIDDKKMGEQNVTPYIMDSLGRKQYPIFINESGLYALIFGSKLESAKRFKHWVTSEVLPSIRKTGYYEMPKLKEQSERLASVNNAVKILTPMLEKAGCDSKNQLLTAKSLYEKAGVEIPLLIQADQKYFDTVHIARQVGLYYQSSGKPADKAVNEIIRRLDIPDSLYTETWESKGKWQGTVRKYASQVIDMVKQWIADNEYPRDIEYMQCDGQTKCYHVIWRDMK